MVCINIKTKDAEIALNNIALKGLNMSGISSVSLLFGEYQLFASLQTLVYEWHRYVGWKG